MSDHKARIGCNSEVLNFFCCIFNTPTIFSVVCVQSYESQYCFCQPDSMFVCDDVYASANKGCSFSEPLSVSVCLQYVYEVTVGLGVGRWWGFPLTGGG